MSPRDPWLWELSPVGPPYRYGLAVAYDAGSSSGEARKQPIAIERNWSLAGAVFLEIDPTLLTVRLLEGMSGLEQAFRADLRQEPLQSCLRLCRSQRQQYNWDAANGVTALWNLSRENFSIAGKLTPMGTGFWSMAGAPLV